MASSDIIRLTKGQLALLGQQIEKGQSKTGTTDPSSSTEGEIGQLYVNTESGAVFYCSNIEEESGGTTTYTWSSFGGDGGTQARRQTGVSSYAPSFVDLDTFDVAGNGTAALPLALRTYGSVNDGTYGYISIGQPSGFINNVYAGGYACDTNENYWEQMQEVELAKMSDVPTVAQTTGSSTTKVMSQAATTNAITAIGAGTKRATAQGWNTTYPLTYVDGFDQTTGVSGFLFPAGDNLSDFPMYAGIGIYAAQTENEYIPYLLTASGDDEDEGTVSTPSISRIARYSDIQKSVHVGGTTSPTSSTEGQIGSLYTCVENNTPAIYMCTAIDTSVTPNTYTWAKLSLTAS